MLTNSELKNIIVNNLNDNRLFSIQSFLTRLIKRSVFGNGINQYRIKNLDNNTFITTLAEFSTHINHDELIAEYNYSENATSDKIHSFIVIIGNYEVELDLNSTEDIIYLNKFGLNNKKIMFLLNYLNDNDTSLPIKITDVKLINN